MRKEIKSMMLDLKAEIVDLHGPCEGTGWLESVVPGKINPCECMKVFHYLNTLIEAKIPRDYWWLALDDLEITLKYKKLCQFYVKRMPKAIQHGLGLMFFGLNGIGKTSMQCGIGKEGVVLGYKVQYFTAQQYIESRKTGDDDLTAEFEGGQIILLDEMDKVYIKTRSDYVTKTLEDFLRRKTAAGSVFIICTNHDTGTLEKVFGPSTMSMLRRHLRFVEVEGADYSKRLQGRWSSLMESGTDYYADEIVSMAQRMMDREIKEDDIAWEQTYRRTST